MEFSGNRKGYNISVLMDRISVLSACLNIDTVHDMKITHRIIAHQVLSYKNGYNISVLMDCISILSACLNIDTVHDMKIAHRIIAHQVLSYISLFPVFKGNSKPM